MSFIKETLFEVAIPDGVKNTSGKFNKLDGEKLVPEDCSSGMLCVQHSLTENEGYEVAKYKDGNDWNYIAAANGKVGGNTGDATGIYAFNNYARNRAVDGNGNVWVEGRNTLGIGLPAGERGDFKELFVGKQYFLGKGNFATAPADDTHKFATIKDGRLVAAAAAPTSGGEVYFKILGELGVTEGSADWGTKYRLLVCRAAVTAGGTQASPANGGAGAPGAGN